MSNLTGNVYVQNLSAGVFNPPANCITDVNVITNAKINADKLEHRHAHVYAQNGSVASAAERKAVHIVRGTNATINEVAFGSRTLCTVDAAITCDLKKNGTSVLSAAIVLNSSSTAYGLQVGSLSSSALVQGDVLEIVITVAAGAGALGQGVYAVLTIDEDAN